MDKKNFDDHLNKIFNLKESISPEEIANSVKMKETSDLFRNLIRDQLSSIKKSPNVQPHTQVGPGEPGVAIMEEPSIIDERENPISVATIKSQVQNFGPEAFGQIVSNLSAEMNKVNVNGQPTSEYNQLIDSIKQDGLELILKVSSEHGGVKVPASGAAPTPAGGDGSTNGEDQSKEPGQELSSL